MKKIAAIVLLISFVGIGWTIRQHKDTNAKIKAVFMYNFTKYIEWPESYRSGDFIICIFGDSPLISELNDMAVSKTAGSRHFKVQKINSANEIGKCNILFVPEAKTEELTKLAALLKGKSTLIISESPEATKKGAIINFIVVNNKQKFELNTTNAENHGLLVGTILKKLAIVVD